MHNLDSKEHIDKLVQDAADNYQAPISPNWTAMQQKLDDELPTKKRKRKLLNWLLYSAVTLLIVFVSSYIFIKGTNNTLSKQTGTTYTANISSTVPSSSSNTSVAGKIAATGLIVSGINALVENAKSNSKANTTVNNAQYPSTTFTKSTKDVQISNTSNNITQLDNYSKKIKVTQPVNVGIQHNDSSNRANEQSAISFNISDSSSQLATNNKNKHDSVNSKVLTNDTLQQSIFSTKSVEKIKNKKQTYWIAEVAGITDITSVKLTNLPNLSWGVGALVGYQFNKRFGLFTGAYFTQKNYEVAGSDFHPPNTYWTNFHDLNKVNGFCRMWELPLVARYNLSTNSNLTPQLAVGLSSYLMQREYYQYYYTVNGQSKTRTWERNVKENYIMSVLHIGFGFSKPLTKQLFLHVEPYAKLPLKGVGFGKLQLSSYGVQLSLQVAKRK